MNRKTIVILISALMMICLLSTPTGIQSDFTDLVVVDYPKTDDLFIMSSEGTIHPDSLRDFDETLDSNTGLDPDSDTNADFEKQEWGFSETIEDDVLYYPDWINFTAHNISQVISYDNEQHASTELFGSLSSTYTNTTTTYPESHDVFPAPTDSCFMLAQYASSGSTLTTLINFTDISVNTFSLHMIYGAREDASSYNEPYNEWDDETADQTMYIYNYLSSAWEIVKDGVGGSYPQNVQREFSADCVSASGNVSLKYYSDPSAQYFHHWLFFFQLVEQTGDDFVDTFYDVLDWSIQVGNTITTDGDVGSFHIDGDNVWDYYYTNTPSIANMKGMFIEFVFSANISDSLFRVYGFALDDHAGTSYALDEVANLFPTTSYQTKRFYLTHDVALESIRFQIKAPSSDTEVKFDYLRVGSVMGWGHDGSTTEGIETETSTGQATSLSTDGDVLTIQTNKTGGTDTYYWNSFQPDTTTTEANLEYAYYPWFEIKWRVIESNNAEFILYVNLDDTIVIRNNLHTENETTAWMTTQLNLKEGDADSADYDVSIYTYYQNAEDTGSIVIEVDYCKLYDFNNWTYLESSTNLKTSAVCYYDSGEDALVMEKTFDTSTDYLRLATRNQSIEYPANDMVIGLTIKASANTSCRIRPYIVTSDTSTFYYLYDDYQTIWMPFPTSGVTLNRIYLYFYDWTDTTPSSGIHSIYIKDNITVRPSWYDASVESGTYGDSFANVSDYVAYLGNTPTSDGDSLLWDVPDDASYDGVNTNSPSFTSAHNLYYEFTVRANHSSLSIFRVIAYSSDDGGGTAFAMLAPTHQTTTWKTYKGIISTDMALESLRFLGQAPSGHPVRFYIDYFRIAPATEMGYQDDCSTLTGKSSSTGRMFSDSSLVECTSDEDGREFRFPVEVDTDIYPFLEFSISNVVDGDSDNRVFRPRIYDGTDYTYLEDDFLGTAGIYRYNLKAVCDETVYLYFYIDDMLDSFSVEYFKPYSIANFTINPSALLDVDDYLYINDNDDIVYSDGFAYPEYLTLEHDPILSVDIVTYNVWNITTTFTDTDNEDLYFLVTVGGSEVQEGNDETRGAYSNTGTLTDFRIGAKTGGTVISAIEFWEDSTAPTITNIWATPYTPTDDDDLTLAVYVTDGSGYDLYSVILNAIDYPTGFSDVDYSCEKNSEDTALWDYTWSSMTAGYYAFQVTANDGANTDVDVITFRVVPVVLQITDIVLITATDELAQISGHVNKDSSYIIYENDSSIGSGSVSSGWFSISWTKDNTAGTYIELGITFTAGTYSEWINGSYSVASAEVLMISDTTYTGHTGQNTLSGYANLDYDYYVYENDSLITSGSLTGGSFSIPWDRDSADGLILWGVRFNDSSTIRWVNGSYYNDPVAFSLDWEYGLTETKIFVSGYKTLSATYTVYEDNIQISSGSITSLSFWLEWARQESETPTTVDVAVKFINGSTEIWANFSYTETQIEIFLIESWWLSLQLGTEHYVEGYVKTSFENSTIYIYDNGTLQLTVNEDTGGIFFYWWMNEGTGLHNIVLNVTHGSTTFTRERTYYVPDWATTALVVTWNIETFQNNYTLLHLQSNWMNCTYYVYLNSSLVATSANDPVTLNITREINNGEYNLTIYADAGTSTYTIANIRYVVSSGAVTYDYRDVTYTSGGISDTTTNIETLINTFVEMDEEQVFEIAATIVLAAGILSLIVGVIIIVILKQREVVLRLKMLLNKD